MEESRARPALYHQHAHGAGGGAHAHGGAIGQGADEIEHRLGEEYGVVAAQPGLYAAYHRHGADAIEDGAGDEGVGEIAAAAPETPLGQAAQGIYAAVYAQQLANHRADGTADDDAQHVLRADGADHAYAHGGQAQRDHQRICEAAFYFAPAEHANQPAEEHGERIYQDAQH